MAKLTFESAMSRLEEITTILEEGTQTLDASLKLYEESNQLLAFCQEKLNDAEKKIQVISKTTEGFKLNELELE